MFRFIEELPIEVKKEIVRRVSEKVYEELKNNNYLQSAYIFNVSKEVAATMFDIDLIRLQEHAGFSFSIRQKGRADE